MGIVQLDHTLLDQHHRRDGRDRLGHRREAEDRVLAHRLGFGSVLISVRLEVNDLTAPRDQGDGARKHAPVDLLRHHRCDAGQALLGHALEFVGRSRRMRTSSDMVCLGERARR
jgi:hypothetical protein